MRLKYSKCGKYDIMIISKYKLKAQTSKMTHYMQEAPDDKDTKKNSQTKHELIFLIHIFRVQILSLNPQLGKEL